MITHDEMAGLYGADNIFTLAEGEAEGLGMRVEDARILENVGVPAHAPPFFTTQVSGGPEFLLAIDAPVEDGGRCCCCGWGWVERVRELEFMKFAIKRQPGR